MNPHFIAIVGKNYHMKGTSGLNFRKVLHDIFRSWGQSHPLGGGGEAVRILGGGQLPLNRPPTGANGVPDWKKVDN